ncbi:hypothetical protein CQ13_04205 [Bradyrhizobium retamae]|uniref:Uncharacterized protein n=1 Tax=Bradyrhizobium retamae TaxID=1300035 RepID=A0A0R3NC26_9BRAD|nr:hypothetical protein CQ13_04205 [Bradyrhizobium retamae]
MRPGEAPSDSILIILNYGPSRADVTIGADTIALMQSREFVDLLTGNEIIPTVQRFRSRATPFASLNRKRTPRCGDLSCTPPVYLP